MKFSLVLFALLISTHAGAKIKEPLKGKLGFTNPNSRIENNYEAHPNQKIWHEFGRAYWRGEKQLSALTIPVRKKKMRRDQDSDGIIDSLDQCLNTPRGEKVNAFGCRLAKNTADINLDVKFDLGKASLDRSYTESIDKVARTLKANKNLKIEILGHTDSSGSRDFNLQLSAKRASALLSYLTKEHGIKTSRLISKGFGPDKPLADNGTSTGRRANRRVEVNIISQ